MTLHKALASSALPSFPLNDVPVLMSIFHQKEDEVCTAQTLATVGSRPIMEEFFQTECQSLPKEDDLVPSTRAVTML